MKRKSKKTQDRIWKLHCKFPSGYYNENVIIPDKLLIKMMHLLKVMVRLEPKYRNTYTYSGSFQGHLYHCSDRMNGGRAQEILRLIRED